MKSLRNIRDQQIRFFIRFMSFKHMVVKLIIYRRIFVEKINLLNKEISLSRLRNTGFTIHIIVA